VEHSEGLRQRILELLMPDGAPVGASGHRRGDIRVVQGSLEAAQEFFDRFRELGEPMHVTNHPGEMIALGGEDRVGLRRHSKSGEPTIDVWVQYVLEIRKIKFVQSVNNDDAH
jgi:hypothetical protein